MVLDVAASDGQLVLCAAQLEICARHFRDDRHLRVVQIGLRPLQLGMRRFVFPAHAAEEVELPRRIEARIVKLGVVADANRARRGGYLLLGVAARSGDLRPEIEQRFAPGGADFDQPAQGDAQIVIRAERIVHEPVESVIAELGPEPGLDLFRGIRRRLRAGERRRNGRVGLHVVGADRAACQDDGQEDQQNPGDSAAETDKQRFLDFRHDEFRRRRVAQEPARAGSRVVPSGA